MGISSQFRPSRNLRSTVFSSQKKETYYYITSGWPGLFVTGRRYFGRSRPCSPGKNGAGARQAATLQSSKRDPSLPMVVQDRHPSSGVVWLTITDPPPMFFVSVASKGLNVYVSGLESTLAGISISVDSKWVSLAMNLSSGEAKVRRAVLRAVAKKKHSVCNRSFATEGRTTSQRLYTRSVTAVSNER